MDRRDFFKSTAAIGVATALPEIPLHQDAADVVLPLTVDVDADKMYAVFSINEKVIGRGYYSIQPGITIQPGELT